MFMEEVSPILGPVVALAAWTLVMMTWMLALRFPAMHRKGITMKGQVGGRGAALDRIVEDHVQWKAHNYNHLLEQPTLFYAVALALALMDRGEGISLILAWTYVAFRIAHSLMQATINIVTYRYYLFLGASLALFGLVVQAALILIRG
jgi:hypothetical protein